MQLKFRIILALCVLYPAYAFSAEQFTTERDAQKHCPSDVVVWLNTSSGMVHAKGGKWYGHTKAGAYVCQKEIIATQTVFAEPKANGAKWQAIGKTNALGGGATFYVDTSSIRHHGDNADLWVLVDFTNTQEMSGLKFRSSKFHKEYDCKKRQWRILISSMLEKNMGDGQVVQSDAEPENWRRVEPGSIADDEWGSACGHQ